MRIIEFLAGLLLVLVVFADVFGSVLVPRPAHSRLRVAPTVNRALTPLWRRLARMFPSARTRQDVRGALGPAILVVALACWIAGLSFGFALMLHAQPHNVALDEFDFSEALFQAAMAISTLGLIHAEIHGWARAVVALAGISGFSIISLVVAFLLSIQNALHQRETLVLSLPARAGRPPSACQLLLAYTDAVDSELATLFDSWEAWTAQVLQSHLSYPVLFRFRSLHENAEWLSCLGCVLDAGAAIVAAEPDGFPRTRRAAGFLTATAARAVREFCRLLSVGDARFELDRTSVDVIAQALTRANLSPSMPASYGERLDAIRAGYAGRLPLLARRLDLAWYDTLTGAEQAGP